MDCKLSLGTSNDTWWKVIENCMIFCVRTIHWNGKWEGIRWMIAGDERWLYIRFNWKRRLKALRKQEETRWQMSKFRMHPRKGWMKHDDRSFVLKNARPCCQPRGKTAGLKYKGDDSCVNVTRVEQSWRVWRDQRVLGVDTIQSKIKQRHGCRYCTWNYMVTRIPREKMKPFRTINILSSIMWYHEIAWKTRLSVLSAYRPVWNWRFATDVWKEGENV